MHWKYGLPSFSCLAFFKFFCVVRRRIVLLIVILDQVLVQLVSEWHLPECPSPDVAVYSVAGKVGILVQAPLSGGAGLDTGRGHTVI